MNLLEVVLLIGCLTSTGVCYFLLSVDKDFIIPLAAATLCFLLLILSTLSASQPVRGKPSPPFILYAASGEYAWVGSVDRSAPRTYLWRVPNEIQEALQNGAVLVEEGQEGDGEEEHFPYGEWTVSPLGQEGVEK